ncbi:MAG TPA: hypothetical protein VHL34_06985 [Rhizomicrobium sp.]|jgi:hypothetical protein|nr:hypothetical protein [Rhizomicrobium sp.]
MSDTQNITASVSQADKIWPGHTAAASIDTKAYEQVQDATTVPPPVADTSYRSATARFTSLPSSTSAIRASALVSAYRLRYDPNAPLVVQQQRPPNPPPAAVPKNEFSSRILDKLRSSHSNLPVFDAVNEALRELYSHDDLKNPKIDGS